MTNRRKVLSYTWYPQDWMTSNIVARLKPLERYVYRELIDLAMETENDIEIMTDVWRIRWNFDMENEILEILKTLEKRGAIIIKDDRIFVPKCQKRIELKKSHSERGRLGGQANVKLMSSKTSSKSQANVKPNTIQYNTIEEKEKEKKEKNLSISQPEPEPKPPVKIRNSFPEYYNSIDPDTKEAINQTSTFFQINYKDNPRKMMDLINFFDYLNDNDHVKYYLRQIFHYRRCIKLGHPVCRPDNWFGEAPKYEGKWNERGYQALYDHMMKQDTPQTRKAREHDFWDGMGEGEPPQ